MKSKAHTHERVILDIFESAVHVHVGEDILSVLKHDPSASRAHSMDTKPASDDSLKSSCGYTVCPKGRSPHIILTVRKSTDTGTIAHESLHAVSHILRSLGVNMSADTEEVYAYTLGYVVTEVLKITRAASGVSIDPDSKQLEKENVELKDLLRTQKESTDAAKGSIVHAGGGINSDKYRALKEEFKTLTEEEVHFYNAVCQYPGCKYPRSEGSYSLVENNALWVNLEKLSLIKSVGSYKWVPTGNPYKESTEDVHNHSSLVKDYFWGKRSELLNEIKVQDENIKGRVPSNLSMRYGLDFHGVIDKHYDVLAPWALRQVEAGNEVHIVTGSRWSQELEESLRRCGFVRGKTFTHFFSITDFHICSGNEVSFNDKGQPVMYSQLWDPTKGYYALEQRLNALWDDSPTYGRYMPNNCVYLTFSPDKLEEQTYWLENGRERIGR